MRKWIIFLIVLGTTILPTQPGDAKIQQINEEDIEVIPLQSTGLIEVVASKKEITMKVNHQIREGDVHVECFVDPFTFSKEKVGHVHKEGEGHIRLYINGKHVDTIFQGAFIIKGLPTGNHELKIEVVKNDKTSYDLEETFSVTIP